MKWLENNCIQVDVTKKPKKITGTRFAAILGSNVWSSPFKAWCEITKTYEDPFKESIYTLAGKIIESRQVNYLKKAYFMEEIKTPVDVYGRDFFKVTYGDFFKNEPIFGGMWDALNYEDKEPACVIECKTTKRAEDWNDDIPEYYALQAALYAYLKGLDDVVMIVSFLDDETYQQVQYVLDNFSSEEISKMIDNGKINEYVKFKPNSSNTAVRPFKLSERYPNFDELVNKGRIFWENHVLTGISPAYDEKVDAEILKELRKNTLNPTTDIDNLLVEADTLQGEINVVLKTIADKQDRLDVVMGLIKDYMSTQFREGDTKISLSGKTYEYTLSKSSTTKIDKDLLKQDGLLNRYEITSESTRFTKKEIKKEIK